ncbi:hypothetical protein [Phosphitispora sp. TUW77]|uniref:hypothetical protein n=1 Tax=Phosphitispora sp. TUW77 TaxID=3152361 RepID=UPI003AB15813
MSNIPSDIWKGMTCEGAQPYKNTAYSIVNAHAGAVEGLVLDKIIPSSGDPALDSAIEQVGYTSLISPSTWIDVYDLYNDVKTLLKIFK